MVKPIFGQTSRVVTKPLFDADGVPVAYVEAQDRPLVEQIAKEVRHKEDTAGPLAGNTQRHWKHVAEIPNVFVNMLMRDGRWDDPQKREEWLRTECPRDFLVGGKYD